MSVRSSTLLGVFVLLVSVGIGQESEILREARDLRLRGELRAACSLLRDAIQQEGRSASDQIHLRLELAKVLDRIGLHTNTRPVEEALEQIRLAESIADGADPVDRAHVALAFTEYFYRAGIKERSFAVATSHAEQALSLFQRVNDSHGMAETVHYLGLIGLQEGSLDSARTLFERSRMLDIAGGERLYFRGEVERHIGFVLFLSGDVDRSILFFERSLEARRASGARDASLFAARILAAAYIDAGRHEEALPHLLYGLAMADRIDSPVGKARCAYDLGRMYEASGDITAAATAYELARMTADLVEYTSIRMKAQAALNRLQDIPRSED